SKIINKHIVYTNPSIFKFRKRMVKKGLNSDFIWVMIGIYTTAKLGLAKKVTSDLSNLLDRNPITMQKFIYDHKELLI
ncbi:hypothetical protein, partial [Paraburkholderia sp. SIMBA_054]